MILAQAHCSMQEWSLTCGFSEPWYMIANYCKQCLAGLRPLATQSGHFRSKYLDLHLG